MDLDERILALTKLGSCLRNDFIKDYRDKINEIQILNPGLQLKILSLQLIIGLIN